MPIKVLFSWGGGGVFWVFGGGKSLYSYGHRDFSVIFLGNERGQEPELPDLAWKSQTSFSQRTQTSVTTQDVDRRSQRGG